MCRLKAILHGAAFCVLMAAFAGVAYAATYSAEVYEAGVGGQGKRLGTVTFADSSEGLAITTNLSGLPEGEHGFHVHEKPDCSAVVKDGKHVHAGAAGGHYDPAGTGRHRGPDGGGHRGDLPVLKVGADGTARVSLLVKDVKAEEFKGRAVMIHEGGDNYSDDPFPLGGGGARIGCGIIR